MFSGGGCLRSKLICEGFSSEGKPSKNRAVPLQPLIYQALTEKTQSTLYEIYHFIDGDPPYQFPRVKMVRRNSNPGLFDC